MDLQEVLVNKFKQWSPPAPVVVARSKSSVTLEWQELQPFHFLSDQLLFRLEKNDKIPPWFVVYRGGKTTKEIDNLAPRYPHKFRLRVIVKAEAVPSLAERALQHYGDEATVHGVMKTVGDDNDKKQEGSGDNTSSEVVATDESNEVNEQGQTESAEPSVVPVKSNDHKWLESQWSEQTWTSTDTDGTSVLCFCMAVRCGYLKQVQGMLEERPELIGIVNAKNGFTPLATAVRKGDINTVRFLLNAGAEVDQRSANLQTALHIAVYTTRLNIVQLLLDQGADFQAQDINGLRVEHYAVDSGDLDTLRYILDNGGDVHAEDNNGWTPLFRALCQGAKSALVEELVVRGSVVEMTDRAGLPLTSVARLLATRQGRSRESILRLVDSSYPHEKALANFTRLTKKIYNVHSLLKLPSLHNKKNLKK